jgi:two-component system, OmpR family, response regulator AdeR
MDAASRSVPGNPMPSRGPSVPAESLVLIAEDEPDIGEILAAYLRRSGLRSVRAFDGADALAKHRTHRPDLVLLDVQMPVLDGWQVLREIRHRGDTPVIMLTAMDQDVDKLTGLRIGADDYVVKPFNPAEVVARVEAVLRRTRVSAADAAPTLRAGPIEIDADRHAVTLHLDDGLHAIDLTLTEFKLLAHLLRAPERVCSRAELLAACLPEGDTLERTVDSHVSKLRRKLEAAGLQGVPESVRGVGYRVGRAA